MKTILFLLPLFLTALGSAQVPEFKLAASYGLGFANYSEDGTIRPLQSDWSAWAGDVFLEAQGRLGKTYTFFNVRLTGTDRDTETWKENGVLVQENEMSMGGVDFNAGVTLPLKNSWGTLTPSLGLFAGFQSYTRENFVFFNGEDSVLRARGTLTEDVQSYGVGGGLAVDFPLGEQWSWGAESSAFWLFYILAENDGFDTEIEGNEGVNWESSLWFAKKLKKAGQSMGLRLTADIQLIQGDITMVERTDTTVEWPDNDWQYYSLSMFWRGEF